MNRLVLIGVATAAAFSTAAFAQTNPTPAPGGTAPAKTTQESVKAPSLRQEVLDSLHKAGFKDISVKANSFFVQAKDKEGHDVTMVLGPDSFTAVMAVGSNGMTPAETSADASPFATVPAKDKLSSEVVGLPVYNNDHKEIGSIKDIAFDNAGAGAYVLAVGGFVGMSDHYVAVRPSAINLSYNASDKKWHAEMNTSAAQLKVAPEYKFPTNS